MVKRLSEWFIYASKLPLEKQPAFFDWLYILQELDQGKNDYYLLPENSFNLPNTRA